MIPSSSKDINSFYERLKRKEPFSFIRFSDGELEIIRNRYLKISNGKTHFKGRIFNNKFSQIDTKEFDPVFNSDVREDLIFSAITKMPNFFKGMPHKRYRKDRDLLVTLNGGIDSNITFADLLINSNYKFFREKILPVFPNYDKIYLIANYRAKPKNIIKNAIHIKIQDNFFSNYKNVKKEVFSKLKDIPSGSLILSSASSLSNIIGHELFKIRKDITFIDVGTSINDLMNLNEITRSYHVTYFSKGLKPLLRKMRPSFYIRW